MAGLLVIFFPLLLLAFLLFMERVESPLRRAAVESQVEEFLDNARADEVDTFVRYGMRRAIDRWRNRRRLTMRPQPSRRTSTRPAAPSGTPPRTDAGRHRAAATAGDRETTGRVESG